MKKTWVDKLHNKYLHLFELYDGEDTKYTKKGQPVRGIECGIGWKKRVEELLIGLDNCLKTAPYIPNPDKTDLTHLYIPNPEPLEIKIFQIKEKFGCGTVYISHTFPDQYPYIDRLIGRFEGTCSVTCESCGTVESDMIKKRNGWIVCICKKCFEESNNENG